MELQKDIREFIESLLSHKVEFLLVGGYALAFHGAPRFTEDIDFLLRISPENAERVESVLEKFGFGKTGIGRQDFLQPAQVIQLGRPPNRIDLLTSISGVGWEEAWAARERVNLAGLDPFLRETGLSRISAPAGAHRIWLMWRASFELNRPSKAKRNPGHFGVVRNGWLEPGNLRFSRDLNQRGGGSSTDPFGGSCLVWFASTVDYDQGETNRKKAFWLEAGVRKAPPPVEIGFQMTRSLEVSRRPRG